MRFAILLGSLVVVAPALAGGSAPRAIVIAVPHSETATSSEVRWVDITSSGPKSVRTVRVPHARGAVVRGDPIPNADAAAIVCDDDSARDPEYGATLYRADASGLKQLATGLVHASRPLASIDGSIYVERGARGPQRVDALTIDAIDAAGSARTLVSWSGFALHLAGELGGDLLVYRVSPTGADIVAIDRRTSALRTISAVAPFARDFSVDQSRGALVYSTRDGNDWIVERLDLASGARTRLHQEADDAPAPFALPNGDVAWTAPRRTGLALPGKTIAPLGMGFDSVRAVASDLVIVAHVPPSGWDTAAIVDLASGATFALPNDVRIEPVGFVGSHAVLR
jgi:hypothetical protein